MFKERRHPIGFRAFEEAQRPPPPKKKKLLLQLLLDILMIYEMLHSEHLAQWVFDLT